VKLYQQGLHLPTYARLMLEMGVEDVSLNFMGMRQRVKNLWQLDKKFDSTFNIFVDSGCHTINDAKEHKYTDDELRSLAADYYRWVGENISRIELYGEFDSIHLGPGFLEEQRDTLRDVAFDKFLPIWHGDDGLDDLNSLAERFGRVGIPQTLLNGRDLVPVLNRLARSGVKLHGLSMTKPDLMKAVKWESVSSTSWTSPARFGDTIVWSHNQLKRYPKSMKDQSRKKERSTFTSAGFDLAKINADDSQEMLRVSLWSWKKLIASLNRTGVTITTEMPDEDFTELDTDQVGTDLERVQNRLPTPTRRDPSQMRPIPLLAFDTETNKVKNKDTGLYEDVEISKVKTRSESMRICDTCFLAAKCPMFEPNSTCAYDIPIVIRTKEQVTSLMDTLVEMQAQRVLFMKMAEDTEGGYADPNLSSEIDRLGKLMKTKHDMEQEGFSLTVTAKQQGQMSMVSNLFGDMTNQSFSALPAAISPELAVEQLGIMDAEILGEY